MAFFSCYFQGRDGPYCDAYEEGDTGGGYYDDVSSFLAYCSWSNAQCGRIPPGAPLGAGCDRLVATEVGPCDPTRCE